MNELVKKLWIAALRSGDYPQGKNALRADGAFCCLGVLCDIYREHIRERLSDDDCERGYCENCQAQATQADFDNDSYLFTVWATDL